jgi:GTP-binding protein
MDLTAGVGTDGNLIVVGGDKGMLLAFDMDGKPLWKTQLSSEILSSPVVGQGIVVARSVDNRIVGIDAATGEKKWTVQRAAPPLTLRLAPGMVVHDKDVIIAQPGGKLLSLIMATGAPRWEVEVGVARGATELERVTDIGGYPVVFEDDVCAVSYQGRAGCWDVPPAARAGPATCRRTPASPSTSASCSPPTTRARSTPTTATAAPAPGRTTSWPSAACRPRFPTAARSRSATTRATCTSCRARTAPSWPVPQPTAARSARPAGGGLEPDFSNTKWNCDRDRGRITTYMKPVIALVGRPNVGKSTLFNRMTRSRDALVADLPGLTRDRHYGEGRMGERPFLVIDTGGFEPVAKEGIMHEMALQTKQAVAEADIVMFIVDGRQGLTPHDKTITDFLRKSGRKVMLVVNKSEGMKYTSVTAEFYELGMGDPYVISAAHGDGVLDLVNEALDEAFDHASAGSGGIRSGRLRRQDRHVGRPNVGKSTLINTLVGEQRVIAFDMPGTTRDSIEVPFEKGGKHYTLIDTAGIRRRGKVFEAIEKFSVVKTLQSISEANVVVLLLDAQQDIAEQDAHIAGFILETGRALVVAVNKWDGLTSDQRDQVKIDLDRKLDFLSFAEDQVHFGAEGHRHQPPDEGGRRGLRRGHRQAVDPAPDARAEEAVEKQEPKRKGSTRPKMRYAHQGGQNPPIIVIHGNALDGITEPYKRYLEKHFRDTFDLIGTPLRIELRSGKNPFAKEK